MSIFRLFLCMFLVPGWASLDDARGQANQDEAFSENLLRSGFLRADTACMEKAFTDEFGEEILPQLSEITFDFISELEANSVTEAPFEEPYRLVLLEGIYEALPILTQFDSLLDSALSDDDRASSPFGALSTQNALERVDSEITQKCGNHLAYGKLSEKYFEIIDVFDGRETLRYVARTSVENPADLRDLDVQTKCIKVFRVAVGFAPNLDTEKAGPQANTSHVDFYRAGYLTSLLLDHENQDVDSVAMRLSTAGYNANEGFVLRCRAGFSDDDMYSWLSDITITNSNKKLFSKLDAVSRVEQEIMRQ